MNYKTEGVDNITSHFVGLSRQVIFAAIKYYKLSGDKEVVIKLKLAKERAKILRAKLTIQEKENALNSENTH